MGNNTIPNANYISPLKKELTKNRINYKYKLKLNSKGLIRFSVLSRWCKDKNDSSKLRHLLDLIINNYDELTKKVKTNTKKITEMRSIASIAIAELWNEVTDKSSLYDILIAKATIINPDPFLYGLYDNLRNITNLLEEKGGKRVSLPEFLKNCGNFVAPGKNPNGFLNEIEEWENELKASTKTLPHDPVKIYNMPSSKGLEADIVCVVGVTDNILPNSVDDLDEQARLFYVAMTRAKRELHLFSARTRSGATTYVNKSFQMKRSKFVDVIPDAHIELKYVGTKKKISKSKT